MTCDQRHLCYVQESQDSLSNTVTLSFLSALVFLIICSLVPLFLLLFVLINRGYLPDGTPMNRAGNAINHPETIGPDPHTPGSPLPRAEFCNSVGYLPDGTAMNAAGGGWVFFGDFFFWGGE